MSRYDDFSLQQANQFRVTTDGSITIAEAPSQDLPTKCVVLNPINNSTVAPVTIFYQPTNDNKIVVLKRLEEQQECSEDDIINEIKKIPLLPMGIIEHSGAFFNVYRQQNGEIEVVKL